MNSKYGVMLGSVAWANDSLLPGTRSRELLNLANCNSSEFVFGATEIAAGTKQPLHRHHQTRVDYLVSGRAWVRRGKYRVEIGPDSSCYFPANIPHAYEVIGDEPLSLLHTYASEKNTGSPLTELSSEEEANRFDTLNLFENRWAVADDFEPWQLWEPSKGRKGLHWKTLFDSKHGGLLEMHYGTCFLPPNGNYSPHHHEQPEVFYCLSGEGIIGIDEESIPMTPGLAAYVPKHGVHTIDCLSAEPLVFIWIYGTEVAGENWRWTPVADIALQASPR